MMECNNCSETKLIAARCACDSNICEECVNCQYLDYYDMFVIPNKCQNAAA